MKRTVFLDTLYVNLQIKGFIKDKKNVSIVLLIQELIIQIAEKITRVHLCIMLMFLSLNEENTAYLRTKIYGSRPIYQDP